MPSAKFANIQVHHAVKEDADKLARKLAKEKGVKVPRHAAIRIAVEEALTRRAGK